MSNAGHKLGVWMSAALSDPHCCKEMKADITAWFDAGGHLPEVFSMNITEEMVAAGERVDPNEYAAKGAWVEAVLQAALSAALSSPEVEPVYLRLNMVTHEWVDMTESEWKTNSGEKRKLFTSPPFPKAEEVIGHVELKKLNAFREKCLDYLIIFPPKLNTGSETVPVFTSFPKAEYDAAGTPLTLLAAAKDALIWMEGENVCDEQYREILGNLRKFTGGTDAEETP